MAIENPPRAGKLIALEGIEGAGKTTAMQWVVDYLKQQGKVVHRVREPGGTQIAELIREQLLKKQYAEESLQPISELLLMFAARAQNIHYNIAPALKAGEWVVCDRFVDASYAYQGAGRQLPEAWIEQLQHFLGDVAPDLVLLLDLDVAVSRQRLAIRQQPSDRIEQEQSAFFERVRAGYLKRASQQPSRYAVIAADQSIEAVQAQLQRAIDAFLQQEDERPHG